MKKIGNYTFPETLGESRLWIAERQVRALNRDVLAVANTQVEGAWRAYIGAVPGVNHDLEVSAVWSNGGALPHNVALAIFPRFKDIPYAH